MAIKKFSHLHQEFPDTSSRASGTNHATFSKCHDKSYAPCHPQCSLSFCRVREDCAFANISHARLTPSPLQPIRGQKRGQVEQQGSLDFFDFPSSNGAAEKYPVICGNDSQLCADKAAEAELRSSLSSTVARLGVSQPRVLLELRTSNDVASHKRRASHSRRGNGVARSVLSGVHDDADDVENVHEAARFMELSVSSLGLATNAESKGPVSDQSRKPRRPRRSKGKKATKGGKGLGAEASKTEGSNLAGLTRLLQEQVRGGKIEESKQASEGQERVTLKSQRGHEDEQTQAREECEGHLAQQQQQQVEDPSFQGPLQSLLLWDPPALRALSGRKHPREEDHSHSQPQGTTDERSQRVAAIPPSLLAPCRSGEKRKGPRSSLGDDSQATLSALLSEIALSCSSARGADVASECSSNSTPRNLRTPSLLPSAVTMLLLPLESGEGKVSSGSSAEREKGGRRGEGKTGGGKNSNSNDSDNDSSNSNSNNNSSGSTSSSNSSSSNSSRDSRDSKSGGERPSSNSGGGESRANEGPLLPMAVAFAEGEVPMEVEERCTGVDSPGQEGLTESHVAEKAAVTLSEALGKVMGEIDRDTWQALIGSGVPQNGEQEQEGGTGCNPERASDSMQETMHADEQEEGKEEGGTQEDMQESVQVGKEEEVMQEAKREDEQEGNHPSISMSRYQIGSGAVRLRCSGNPMWPYGPGSPISPGSPDRGIAGEEEVGWAATEVSETAEGAKGEREGEVTRREEGGEDICRVGGRELTNSQQHNCGGDSPVPTAQVRKSLLAA